MQLTDHFQQQQQEIDREGLLHRMINRIRQSLELQEILTATVAEIRSFLGTDRVMVYRFHADSSGETIAESLNEGRLPSLLGLNFPADDIPLSAREMLLNARQRSIVNVATEQIGLSPLNCPETGKPLAAENVRYRPVDPCHCAYLTAMGVKSSLVVPILHYDIRAQQPKAQLWGLLVSHHAETRSIGERELEVVQLVADQVSIAIAQSALLSLARQQAQREATINRVATLLHTLPTIQLQAALEEVVAVFQGCGGRLYITPIRDSGEAQVYTCGTQPKLGTPLEEHPLWQQEVNLFKETSNSVSCAIEIGDRQDRIQALLPSFKSTQIRGILILTLEYRQQFLGYLSIFRHAIDTETIWAGRLDRDRRQNYPRRSFEAWRELKQGQVREWTAEEIELAIALGNHFAMAVQQHQSYQQVQMLNTQLEERVQKRTAQLQQSLEVAQVLKQVTDRIRSSLDLKIILQAIAREVRRLLDTDRVVIYRFTENWLGQVVVEEVADNWMPLLGQTIRDDCFFDRYAEQYRQGRIRAVNNVSGGELDSCHRDLLLSLQVQANLIVPIRQKSNESGFPTSEFQLWGLLIAHECQAPRVWLPSEIELLQQLANQAAIAIQQAELYEQSRAATAIATAQTEQIQLTLKELQQTQSQLIQTEKMSSLGQLVAGVAHEINNPVNFIYGNLLHASQYTQDLLDLLHLYQQHYTNPHPDIQDRAEDIDLEFLSEDLPKLLASMKVGTDRIRQLVLSLRNFSRLDEAERKPVDIHDGIDSTLLILQHRLKSKAGQPSIQIIKDYGKLPLVECYAGQLNQVFMNLLANAIDALEENSQLEFQIKPTIKIHTEFTNNNSVKIGIIDNGAGMPDEVRAKIFDPFFTTKPVGRGTGLGLAISYQIVVEKHGGVLECLSKPGMGTEFWIEIPIG